MNDFERTMMHERYRTFVLKRFPKILNLIIMFFSIKAFLKRSKPMKRFFGEKKRKSPATKKRNETRPFTTEQLAFLSKLLKKTESNMSDDICALKMNLRVPLEGIEESLDILNGAYQNALGMQSFHQKSIQVLADAVSVLQSQYVALNAELNRVNGLIREIGFTCVRSRVPRQI